MIASSSAKEISGASAWLILLWVLAGAYAFVLGAERNRLGFAVLGAVMYGSIVAVAIVRATGWA